MNGRIRNIALLALCALLLLLAVPVACAPADAVAQPVAAAIRITAPAQGDWTVEYRLPTPATELRFARSPDASRGWDWRTPPGFEIGTDAGGERVRRADGRAFRRVMLRVPPHYRDLPKDYAPFSPHGDGGTGFHSGRFFACAGLCPGDARFAVEVRAPGRSVLSGGALRPGGAAWIDGGEGRGGYVGRTAPAESGAVVALVDRALPASIRAALLAEIPAFMARFAARLGALDERVAIFASYDLAHPGGGWGRQGGTLPGQLFVHFYGPAWSAELAKPGFADDLSWHFAHEAAHLYQRGLFAPDAAEHWVHEGGAEMLAALAIAQDRPALAARKRAEARTACTAGLGGRGLRQAVAAGDHALSYSCGLLLHDALARRIGAEAYYALWRAHTARAGGGEAGFLARVAARGGDGLAETLRAAAADRAAFRRFAGI